MATSYVVYYDTEEEKSRILAAMLEHNGSRDKGQVLIDNGEAADELPGIIVWGAGPEGLRRTKVYDSAVLGLSVGERLEHIERRRVRSPPVLPASELLESNDDTVPDMRCCIVFSNICGRQFTLAFFRARGFEIIRFDDQHDEIHGIWDITDLQTGKETSRHADRRGASITLRDT